jgi:hypothetical protein
MTLTRQLPSLRRTLPDPLAVDLWPEATVATTIDVVVSGISLLRLVEVCGTPCTHSGAAVLPGTGGRPSPTARSTVTVMRVTDVALHPSGCLVVRTDAHLDNPTLIWSETRLIARVSTAHTHRMVLDRGAVGGVLAQMADVELPADLRVGDLLVIPSRPLDASPMLDTWLSGLE